MEIKLFHDLLYKSVDSNHDIHNNYNISFLNDDINTVSQKLYKLSKEKQLFVMIIMINFLFTLYMV